MHVTSTDSGDRISGAYLAGLILLNLPSEATVDAIAAAPPLGGYAEVAALLQELLPGATLDESGHLVFARADYAIAIDLAAGDPVPSATLTLNGQPSVVAIRRLLRRTGWRLFDPARREFIAAEVLGTVLAETRDAGPPAALRPPVEREIAHHGWEATGEAARRYGRLIAGLLVLLVLGTVGWWSGRRDPIDVNERQAIMELELAGRANRMLHGATNAYASVEELANPSNAAKLGQGLLPPFYRSAVRNGYRFTFRGEPFTRDGPRQPFVLIEPGFREFVYVAVPVEPGVTGRRSFAYYSEQSGIYARDGIGVPTPEDVRLDTSR